MRKHWLIGLALALAQATALAGCAELDGLRSAEPAVSVAMPKAIATKTGIDLTQDATPPTDAELFALDGSLNQADITALLHLQFPQSYEAISGRFGYPAYQDATKDYYKLPNGRWAAISYDGYTAVSYSFSDSQ